MVNRDSSTASLASCILAVATLAGSWAQANPLAEVLSADEAAVLLRLPREAIDKLIAAGAIPGRVVGEEWRSTKSALKRWLGSDASGNGVAIPGAQPISTEEARVMLGRGATPAAASTNAGDKGSSPAKQTSADLLLRDRGVLSPAKKLSYSLTGSYTRAEREVDGTALTPNIFQGQRTAGLSGAIRYGLTNNIEVGFALPLSLQQTSLQVDGERVSSSRDHHAAPTISAHVNVMHESARAPNVVLGVSAQLGTERAGSALVALTKSFDPIVLLFSTQYTRPIGSASTGSATSAWSVSAGVAYAASDQISFSSSLAAQRQRTDAATTEQYQLALGLGLLIKNYYLEPTISFALTGVRTVTTSLSLSF